MSREAVPKLNQRIRFGADRDLGISAVRMTPQWRAAMRKYRSFADNLPNDKIAGEAASLTTTSSSRFLSVTRKLTPGWIR